MLTYDEALQRILATVTAPLSAEKISVGSAMGRAIAEDIHAEFDLPPFDNSAVDGYAMDGRMLTEGIPNLSFPQAFEIPTGTIAPPSLPAGSVARIFTGAMVPEGVDRIIMQEDTERTGSHEIRILAPGEPGDFIRKKGSDVAKGTTVLYQGQNIHPGVIGLLSSLNISEIAVHARPTVAVLTTGDEVVPTGSGSLNPGQIYNSNGPALEAAVHEAGGSVVFCKHLHDDEGATRSAFEECKGCDVIITSGGVSVGDRDFVKAAAEEQGTLDFWRVAIRPGKPLAFGKIGDSLYFGLPGNPVSSLVTFELFVRPVIRKLLGQKSVLRPEIQTTLERDLRHEPGRREFVRARVEWRDNQCFATPTGAQGSHRLSSLLTANAFLMAHENHGDYTMGDKLPAILLL
jgi:molybdopterin molybdotransferase